MSAIQSLDQVVLAQRATRYQSAVPRPFLRWAGSKRMLAKQIIKHLPQRFSRYWEPFLGGGAMYFLLQPTRAVLGDTASQLIQTYNSVRDSHSEIAALLSTWPVDRETFNRVREQASATGIDSAARFIYLNKTAWNGLYRVNSRGDFNVPYGLPKSSKIVDADNFEACSLLLQKTQPKIINADFRETLDGVKKGDLVFLDPPYVTKHDSNGFVDYNEKLFSWHDQLELATLADDFRRKGAKVLVTNAAHPSVEALYEGFTAHPLSRRSTLASDKAFRSLVQERLFVS